MELASIVAEIDKEIARLQQAKTLLSGEPVRAKRGRPKSVAVKPKKTVPRKKKAVRHLSPEGRKAIAEAMKRRWAERKKLAAAKK
jgi:hypothetical protein